MERRLEEHYEHKLEDCVGLEIYLSSLTEEIQCRCVPPRLFSIHNHELSANVIPYTIMGHDTV